MTAAMYAIAALATAEEAKVIEEQRSAAVRAEILNILNFEVLQWVRRKEVTVVEWSRRVLTRVFTILKSDNQTVKSRQITGAAGRPQRASDCQKGEN